MPIFKGNFIEIQEKDFRDTVRFFDKAAKAFGDRWLKDIQARNARKHFVSDMQRRSPSKRIAYGGNGVRSPIGVTTAKKYTSGPRSIRVGVVKNDSTLFPKFSAQALASVIEYGTDERFRKTGVFSAQSTGSMPVKEFLRPSWEANKEPFMRDVEQSIERKFAKETG